MAGNRVLTLLPGVGPKKAQGLLARVTAAPGFDAWRDIPEPAASLGSKWEGLVGLMSSLHGPPAPDLATQIRQIRLFYTPLLERLYDDARARLQDLEQLEGLAVRFPDRAVSWPSHPRSPSYTEDLAVLPCWTRIPDPQPPSTRERPGMGYRLRHPRRRRQHPSDMATGGRKNRRGAPALLRALTRPKTGCTSVIPCVTMPPLADSATCTVMRSSPGSFLPLYEAPSARSKHWRTESTTRPPPTRGERATRGRAEGSPAVISAARSKSSCSHPPGRPDRRVSVG